MMDYGTIDISLTSISSRMATLEHTLRSILEQSYRDLRIIVHISREPYLLDEGIPEIPPNLLALQTEADGRLEFSYCRNTGPYRKLLPYLTRYWGESRLVVTADDDTLYPKYWLSQLVEAYDQFHCCIAYRGHRMVTRGDGGFKPYRSWMLSKIEENPSQLILPTGKDGILYDTAFCPENILNIDVAVQLAPTTDDLWFRWNLAMNNVPVFVLNSDYRTSLVETDYDSSLYLNYNRAGGNDVAIVRLIDYFAQKDGFILEGSNLE
jgi:hypothetical protein